MFGKTILQFLLIALLIAAIVWLFSDIVSYMIVAFIFAVILKKPTIYLSQLQIMGVRLSRSFAAMVSLLLLFIFFALFIAIFAPLISEQIMVISNINRTEMITQLFKPIGLLENYLITNGVMSSKETGVLEKEITSYAIRFFKDIDFTLYLNNIFNYTSGFVAGIFASLFITFFILKDQRLLQNNIIALIPNRYFEIYITAIIKIERLLTNYLLGLFMQMLSIFMIVSFGLLLFGIPYAFVLAVFAAISNLIPYIGPFIGGAFGLAVAYSTLPDLHNVHDYLIVGIKVVGVFVIMQLIDNIILQPIIFSKSLEAHPLEIFLVVFAGASLAGIFGMVLAIPVYTVVKVIVIEYYRGYKKYKIFHQT